MPHAWGSLKNSFISPEPLKPELLKPILSVFLPVVRDKSPSIGTPTIKMNPSLHGQTKFRYHNMTEKQVFILDIIGRGEAFSKHRFQMSGFRLTLPQKLRSHDYFFKLNDEV